MKVSNLRDRRSSKLSVVIPAKNAEATLGKQLDALLKQVDSLDAEIIVVDNGSTDRTPELVRSYARRTSLVRLVSAARGSGVAYARNVGVLEARSPCIAICDADDLVSEGWVEAMGEALRTHELVTGPLELERLNPVSLAGSRGQGHDGPTSFLGIFPFASGGNLGLQRAVWERLGGFDESFHGTEDIEFSLRAWLAGIRLTFVPEAIVHYRYRATAQDLWRQGRSWGASRPLIYRKLRAAGKPVPSRFAGWKSWAWLAVHLGALLSASRRLSWVWVAANRIGHLQGSLKHRTLFI